MDIPSLFMIPSAVSSGKVHSVFPNSTDADFDFNRDSSATRVNSQGLIETVGYFGSELVTNGDFSSGSSGWTISSTAPELRGNSFLFNSSSNFIFRSWSNVSGRTYRINFQGTGNLRYRTGFSGSDGTINAISLPTIVEFEATSNTNRIQIYGANLGFPATGVLDSVSIKEVTGDRARLNYEIEGGLVNTKPSLLLEPQSTNKLTTSNDFSSYSKSGTITVTSNYGISPTGERNSTRVQFGGSNNSLYKLSVHSGNTESNSIYIKGISGETIKFGKGTTVNAGSTFTLNGEWQRIQHQSTTGNQFAINTYSSVTARDIEIFGAQIEEKSYATSYIPTNGSTQTRAAETCNGAGTSSILPSSDGIFYAEIAALANDGTSRVISLSDGSNTNRIHLLYFSQNNFISANYRVSGSTQAFVNVNLSNALLFHKIAWHFRSGKFKLFIDGSLAGSNSNTTMLGAGVINELAFNEAPSSTPFYGKIRDIRVYNTKEMTDSEVDILLTKITS